MILCPRCQQDHVVGAKIKRTGEAIAVCPECEATWLKGLPVTASGFVDLGTHLGSLGLPPLWTELDTSS